MDQRPYNSQSNFMKNMKYSNLFAFIAIMLLFTTCSFWGIPQTVLGEKIQPRTGYDEDTEHYPNPFNAISRAVQYTDTDIIMTSEEITSMFDTITENLLKQKEHNIAELEELHVKKLLGENTYYENLQNLVDKYYQHLMEKNNLAIDKKELEDRLKRINEQLYAEHVKLAETQAKQIETVNAKVSSGTNTLNHEKQLLSEQYEKSKKMIK